MLYHEKVDIQVNKVDIQAKKVDIQTENVYTKTKKVDIQTEKFTSKVFFHLIRLILEEYQILMIMLFKMPFDFLLLSIIGCH